MGNLVTAANVRLIIHRKSQGKEAEWKTVGDDIRNTNSCKVLDADTLKRWIQLAVQTGYTRLGLAIFMQILGIPMGMHASPYLSNLYLFLYEFEFMLQFIHAGRLAYNFFRRWFDFVIRYQDDRWVGLSRFAVRARSVEFHWSEHDNTRHRHACARYKWHGIYPTQYLNITEEAFDEDCIKHQDLEIVRVWDINEQAHRWHCQAYSRKDDPIYRELQPYFVYYNSPEAMLAEQCIYGVIYSEARRVALRCSLPTDWTRGMIVMLSRMFDLGYSWHKSLRQLEKFIVTRSPLHYGMGAASGDKLLREIKKELQRYRP